MDTPTIYVMNQSKAVRDTIVKALLQQFSKYWKSTKNGFYVIFCQVFFLMLVISLFVFLHVKVNSKEIWDKIPFPSFSQKNADVSMLLRFKANYMYLEKLSSYPYFSLCRAQS